MKTMKVLMLAIALTFLTNLNAQITDVVSGVGAVAGMAIYGDDLYFTQWNDRMVSKLDLLALPPTTFESVTTVTDPNHMVIKGSDLYFTSFSDKTIYKLDLSTSPPTRSEFLTGLGSLTGLALKDDDLYFAQYNSKKISKVNISAATPTPTDIITNTLAEGITIKGNNLYIAGSTDGKVSILDLESPNAAVVELTSGLTEAISLSINGNDLYVADFDFSGKILKVDLSTKESTVVLEDIFYPAALLIHNDYLYFAHDDSKISKISLATLSNEAFSKTKEVFLSPNPASHFVQFSGLTEASKENYRIHNVLGAQVAHGITSNKERIDIQHLTTGLYFLKFDKGNVFKFLKQ